MDAADNLAGEWDKLLINATHFGLGGFAGSLEAWGRPVPAHINRGGNNILGPWG